MPESHGADEGATSSVPSTDGMRPLLGHAHSAAGHTCQVAGLKPLPLCLNSSFPSV